nr:MAG: wsv421-like protein [Chiromantes dehaani nimavirus]
MELALIFSLVGIILAIGAIIAVAVVFMIDDRQIIKNIENNKIMMQGNRNDVIRFGTTLPPPPTTKKLLEVTDEINMISESYGKIAIVKNKTDDQMKNIDANLVINSYTPTTTIPNKFNNLPTHHGLMFTKILNATGRDIYIQLVSCYSDIVSTEYINVDTYFDPTCIKNGTTTDFDFACRLSKAATGNSNKFVVDLSISDTGVVVTSE